MNPRWSRCGGRALLWPLFCWLILLPLAVGALVNNFTLNCSSGSVYQRTARSQIRSLERHVQAFRQGCGRLPYDLGELIGVVREPACSTLVRSRFQLIDRLGTPFAYWHSADGTRFHIRALGPDRIYGSADDVVSNDRIWGWPRPWYERLEWWRLISVLLPLLLIVAIGFQPIIVFVGAFRIAWCGWHTPLGSGGNPEAPR